MTETEDKDTEGLTGYVGAGAVVGPVLEEPVLAAHLLWFGVTVPAGLRTLRRAVLHRVVVQLEAFALWSHLAVLLTAAVRSWRGDTSGFLFNLLESVPHVFVVVVNNTSGVNLELVLI